MKNENSWRIEQGKGYREEGSEQPIVMWWANAVEHWDANINIETNISNSGNIYCFSNTPSRQQNDSSMNDDFLFVHSIYGNKVIKRRNVSSVNTEAVILGFPL